MIQANDDNYFDDVDMSFVKYLFDSKPLSDKLIKKYYPQLVK